MRAPEPGLRRAACAASGDTTPLFNWRGGVLGYELPFSVVAVQAFRVHAQVPLAPDVSLPTVRTSHGKPVALIPPAGFSAGIVSAVSASGLVLRPGDRERLFAAPTGREAFVGQIFLEPIFRPPPMSAFSFLGYFPNPDDKAWRQALPPETDAQPRSYEETDGIKPATVTWQACPAAEFENGSGAGAPPAPLGPGVIAYFAAAIESPDERTAVLEFMPTATHYRNLLNGTPCADSLAEKRNIAWYEQQPPRKLTLRKGRNLLLIKVRVAPDAAVERQRNLRFVAALSEAEAGDLKVAPAFLTEAGP